MELKAQFEAAVAQSKTLAEKPDNETLLRLYSLYKQATEGNAPEKDTSGMFDFVGKAKHEAWHKLRGLSQEEAQQQYISFVQQLNAG